MKINRTDLITVPRSRKPGHCQHLGGSDARVIPRLDEAALIRGLWEGGHSRAHATKPPTAQALLLRPIRGKSSRASHKQRQTAAKLRTLMSGIRRLLKSVRHSAAKTLRLLFGTHFRSRQSSPGFPRSGPPRYL
jgi:hypothetical protein